MKSSIFFDDRTIKILEERIEDSKRMNKMMMEELNRYKKANEDLSKEISELRVQNSNKNVNEPSNVN